MKISLGKKFILTLVTVAVSVGGIVSVLWWAHARIRSAAARLDEIKTKTASSGEARKAVREAELLFQKRSADISRIEHFFVDRKEPIDFIESLEKLARLTENQISLAVESSKDQSVLSFRLTVEGTETSVVKYLTLLEVMPYDSRIEEVGFQRAAGTTGNELSPAKIGTLAPTHRLTLLIRVKTRSL